VVKRIITNRRNEGQSCDPVTQRIVGPHTVLVTSERCSYPIGVVVLRTPPVLDDVVESQLIRPFHRQVA
jgi:hypothetical protein